MTTEHKVIGGIGVATLLILIGAIWMLTAQDAKQQAKNSKPFVGEKIADMGSQHVPRDQSHAEYNSNPPTSGPHWGDGVAGPGIKDQPVPDELLLHSMEHGGAILWYKDDLAQTDVDRLKNVFNDASGKKIMLARKNLDVPVALTVWNYQLKLAAIDEAKIKEFIETNNDRAPEKEAI